MWLKHAHTLALITKLCSTEVKFKWTDKENNDFIAMKKIVGRDAYFCTLTLVNSSLKTLTLKKLRLGD